MIIRVMGRWLIQDSFLCWILSSSWSAGPGPWHLGELINNKTYKTLIELLVSQ